MLPFVSQLPSAMSRICGGSIVFGPTCGSAETDEGRTLELAPCVVD